MSDTRLEEIKKNHQRRNESYLSMGGAEDTHDFALFHRDIEFLLQELEKLQQENERHREYTTLKPLVGKLGIMIHHIKTNRKHRGDTQILNDILKNLETMNEGYGELWDSERGLKEPPR